MVGLADKSQDRVGHSDGSLWDAIAMLLVWVPKVFSAVARPACARFVSLVLRLTVLCFVRCAGEVSEQHVQEENRIWSFPVFVNTSLPQRLSIKH